jgi:taurine dioxygenase
MAAKITRLTPAIGAIVEGLQLADATDRDSISLLSAALIEHEVLFFRDQELTPEQQRQFASAFGKLHIHPIYPSLPEQPEIMLLDNHLGFLPDNDTWHTDVTFDETPPLGAILAARHVPPVGGDTLWASGTAAYETLSAPLRSFLEGLTAEHSVVKWGRSAIVDALGVRLPVSNTAA